MSTKAHVLVAIVTVLSLLFILRLVRRRQLRAKYALLWLSVGVAFVVLAVSPGLLNWAAGKVGVAYQPALLFLIGMIFLLLVVVHLSWELSRLEERTRILAEELGLLRTDVQDAPPVAPKVTHSGPPAGVEAPATKGQQAGPSPGGH